MKKLILISILIMFAAFSFNGAKAQTGNALDFSGSDVPATAQYLNIPLMPDLSNFTVEFDLKIKGGNQPFDRFFSSRNSGFELATDELGNIKLWSYDLGVGSWTNFGYQMPIDTWQHVAFVYDGSRVMIYVDGTYKSEISASGNLLESEWFIARKQFDDPLYDLGENASVVIDNFRAWDIAVSDANILANYQNCLVGSEPNLTILYDFDEASGSTVYDKASYGGLQNGTTTNNPAWVTGVSCISPEPFTLANALDFDGIDDQVTIPANAAFDFSAGTIECWIKPNVIVHNQAFISMRTDVSATRWSFHINEDANTIGLWNGTAYNTIGVNIDPDTWYHVALVITTSDVLVYVNGILEGTIPTGMNSGITNLPIVIGSPNDPPFSLEWFNGQIDEVRVWSVARSSTDIAANMYSYITSGDAQWSNMVAYYRFEQGNAGANNTTLVNEVIDYSGNCNKGALTNMALTGTTSNWVFPGNAEAPVLTTNTASSIGSASATLNGNILSIGETNVTTRGFQYSTSACMTSPTTVSETGTYSAGAYSLNATGLNPGTTYYYRSYSTNSKGTSYGETQSFTTLVPLANALNFDGINDQVTIPANAAFDFTTGTIECWIKPGNSSNNKAFISMRSETSSARWSFHVNENANAIGIANNASYIPISVNIEPDIWYHLAMIITTSNVQVYVNGILEGTIPIGMSSGITGLPLVIGSPNDAYFGEYFNGSIDEVRVWNIARSSTDIAANMNSYISNGDAEWSNLVAYYRFDQGNAGAVNTSLVNEAVDYSGNCNKGALTNMALTGTTSNWVFTGNAEAPILTTNTASSIGLATATLNGNIFSIGETNVTTRGFQYSTSACMTSPTAVSETGTYSAGSYSLNATGLNPGTTYYYRSYSTNSKGTSYGEIQSFTTLATYTITYNGNINTGGTAPVDANSPYADGATVTVLDAADLVKTGHTFNGWNTNIDGSGTSYAASATFTMPASNITLYALWTIDTYTITYNVNGATSGTAPIDANSPYAYGANVTVLGAGALVYNCYPFTEWNTASDGSGTSYAAGATFTMPTNNVTLYAQWQGAPLWQNVGNVGFSPDVVGEISLAIHNEIPYVAYQDYANSYKASVMNFDGNNWINLGNAGFSVGGAQFISLAMDNNGIPHVAYRDNGISNKAIVMKFDGNNWVNVGIAGFSAGQVQSTSLAIDNNGTAYVAFEDATYLWKTTVMKFDGTNWVNVGIPGFTAGQSTPSLAIDNSGTPYLAFPDFAYANKATVMKFDGTNWINVGAAGFSADQAIPSLAIDNNGTPYVAYADGANAFKAAVMKFDGTNWINVGIAGFSAGTAQYIKIDIDNNGIPYVGFMDDANSNKATVMKFDGTNWVYVGSAGFSAGGANYISLATSNGIPHLAYQDQANSDKATVMNFKATNYSLAYNGNTHTGGTAPVDNNSPYEACESVTVLGAGDLIKTGHTFNGWNSAADGSGTSYASSANFTMSASNLTLYAQWTLDTYTVTYDANTSTGGTAPGNQTKTYGVDLTLANNSGSLVKTGHAFAGWNTAADGTGTDYAVGAIYSGNAALTLYAKWTADTYIVTYNGNASAGGTAPGNQTKTYGINLTLATNSGSLVKTGHAFAGWNTAADGTGTDYAVGAIYSGNAALTLYAKWTADTYTVTYNGNASTGGTVPGNQTKTYGIDLTLATNSGSLVKTGHAFAGWNTAADGTGTDYAVGAIYSGNAALTLYAKWTADTYTVTYNGNASTGGTVPGNQTKTYGIDLTLANNSGSLVKTGHTFAGWNTAADGSGTDYAAGATYSGNASITLYAKWTADTYIVTYNGNASTGGTVPGNQTKTYGVNLTLATNSGSLVKTGHTFAGWNTAADGTGTDYAAGATYSGNAAITLYAKWTSVTTSPSVSLSAEPGCSGDEINLSYTVLAGLPTEYRIVFGQAAKDQGFTDISYTALPSSNTTDIINFAVPANANYGDYMAEIQMRDAFGIEGLLQSFSFTVNLGADYVVAKFNDVVLCDNSSNSFVSYQWYKDGVMITGATNQYYNDLNGLNGNYSVTVVTTNGQTFHSCEKYFNTPIKKTAELIVYPNPARASEKFAVKINNLTQDQLQGSVMNIYNSRGVLMYSTKEVKQQNDIRLPSNGDYYGVLITRDGIKLSYKVIVIN